MSLKDRLFPAVYDLLGRGWEKKFGRDVRGKALAQAGGRVLEVGAGTGGNLPHFPPAVEELVITDASAGMLRRAERRSAALGRKVELVLAPAAALPFEDASFDTVVCTAVLCTVPDQAEALREIRRVLRPGGQFLFMEHVRSDDPGRAKWQDRLEGVWGALAGGCHPNRETLRAIEASGLEVAEVARGELPRMPPLVRPLITGRAIEPGS